MDRYAKVEGRYLARSIMECDIRMVKQAVNPCVKGYDEPWPSTSKALFPSPPQRELTLRPIVEEDAPFLKNCLNDERILPWFPMQDEREIDDSVRMWMGSSLQGGGVMALWNGEPCGLANLYLPYYKKFNHQCLLSIVVGEEFRGQGVGAALIEEIMKLAKEKFQIEFLHLEVYQGNPAIHLYERAGFIIYGIDRHFIKEKEGAYRAKILMQRDL